VSFIPHIFVISLSQQTPTTMTYWNTHQFCRLRGTIFQPWGQGQK